MVLTLIGLCIKSMIAAFLAIILVHIIVGWVIPPIGFFYLTVAYICRYYILSSDETKEAVTDKEEKKK